MSDLEKTRETQSAILDIQKNWNIYTPEEKKQILTELEVVRQLGKEQS